MVKLNKIGKIWIGILMLLWVQSLMAGGRNQLLLGGSKNFPVDNTQATFSSEKPSLFLGYYHGIDSEWSAILSLHFRNFYNKTAEQSFSLFSADQAILYKLHLHEAVTMHIGAKLLYLLPVYGPILPLRRNKKYASEIGAAALVGFRYAYSEHMSFFYYLERWRGTKSMLFNGLETMLAVGWDV